MKSMSSPMGLSSSPPTSRTLRSMKRVKERDHLFVFSNMFVPNTIEGFMPLRVTLHIEIWSF